MLPCLGSIVIAKLIHLTTVPPWIHEPLYMRMNAKAASASGKGAIDSPHMRHRHAAATRMICSLRHAY